MDWLKMAALARPDAPALIAGDEVISYHLLDRAADSVAAALARSEVEPGSRVALWGSITPKTVAAIWGIPRAGAAGVMLRVGLGPEAARDLAAMAGATALWDRVDDPGLVVPGRTGGSAGFWGPPDIGFGTVVFTSGSEGPPKAVALTGGNVAASAAASHRRLGNGPDDPWLCPLPLAHVGGLMTLWRSAREGAPVVLLEQFTAWSASQALGTVRFASFVPTMLRRVVDRGDRFDGLSGVLIGGGPATPALLREAIDLGIPALQTYGSTETSSGVATVAPDEALSRLGTAGTPLAGVDLRITGDDGATLLPGEIGRIEVRGAMVSPGYLGGATRGAGEWLRMPDLGSLDDDGYLTVYGRADRIVVTGGENVDPAEVEQVLLGCDGVVDARVYGEPDEEWGVALVADVYLDRGHLADVQSCARSRLPGFKVPKVWRSTGPIDRGWKD